MKIRSLFILLLSVNIKSAPLVQSIINNSQIGYLIVKHTDLSACSLDKAHKVVHAYSTFQHEFLIEPGEPSLILRPIYFLDTKTDRKYFLVNKENEYEKKRLFHAYTAFKEAGNKKKFNDSADWLKRWIGGDIQVMPHTIEIFGYVVHLSCIEIHNQIHKAFAWLSFSQSCFSRLVLDIEFKQSKKKGVMPMIKVGVGEGGICKLGVVERV